MVKLQFATGVILFIGIVVGVSAYELYKVESSAANEAPVLYENFLDETSYVEPTNTIVDLEWITGTTTTTTVYVPPEPPKPAEKVVNSTGDGSVWDRLAFCESRGNWASNTGNGFGGGLQFMHQSSYSTWLSFGGAEFAQHPWDASREQQIVVAERVLKSSGWNAWPGCSRKLGLL